MKQMIILAVMLFFAFQVKAQTTVFVKDTTIINDPRLTFLKSQIIPSITRTIAMYNRITKLAGDTIAFKQETNAVIRKIENDVALYEKTFIRVADFLVDSAAVANELTTLTQKINVLKNDDEFKLYEEMPAYKTMISRQAKLTSYYNQILNQ